jgi:hypothetical protein
MIVARKIFFQFWGWCTLYLNYLLLDFNVRVAIFGIYFELILSFKQIFGPKLYISLDKFVIIYDRKEFYIYLKWLRIITEIRQTILMSSHWIDFVPRLHLVYRTMLKTLLFTGFYNKIVLGFKNTLKLF